MGFLDVFASYICVALNLSIISDFSVKLLDTRGKDRQTQRLWGDGRSAAQIGEEEENRGRTTGRRWRAWALWIPVQEGEISWFFFKQNYKEKRKRRKNGRKK